MESNTRRLASKGFGDLMKDGLNLFTRNYIKLILPLALLSVLAIVLRVVLLADLNWTVSQLGVGLEEIIVTDPTAISDAQIQSLFQYLIFSYLLAVLNIAIGLIFTVIGMCLVGTYVYKNYMTNEQNFSEEFKKAINSKIIIPILVLGVGIPLGAFLLFIPSIIILGFYIFSVYTYNMDTEKSTTSAAHSIEKGAFWRIIGTFIVNWLIILIAGFIINLILDFVWAPTPNQIQSWYNPSTRNYGMLILNNFINTFVDIIFSPLFICLLTPVFASQKAKKEGRRTYYESQTYQQPSYEQPQLSESRSPYAARETSDKRTSGMYCPYCGYYMSKPKKFCANCGENLEFE
ncbi:MAG: conserved membrane protein of unknown function [Promethearchaeota archaeon]|nr:MAG: conserved membrane protein of unknown function [Candidatus Lokiarchaeota archaeon]